ncbi:MAG: helix-turn-helix transcriptional regulator [Janthinobacterium lividum]
MRQLRKVVPYSPSYIYKMVARKEFPTPFQLSPRASCWDASEVRAWLATRMAARN